MINVTNVEIFEDYVIVSGVLDDISYRKIISVEKYNSYDHISWMDELNDINKWTIF